MLVDALSIKEEYKAAVERIFGKRLLTGIYTTNAAKVSE